MENCVGEDKVKKCAGRLFGRSELNVRQTKNKKSLPRLKSQVGPGVMS